MIESFVVGGRHQDRRRGEAQFSARHVAHRQRRVQRNASVHAVGRRHCVVVVGLSVAAWSAAAVRSSAGRTFGAHARSNVSDVGVGLQDQLSVSRRQHV